MRVRDLPVIIDKLVAEAAEERQEAVAEVRTAVSKGTFLSNNIGNDTTLMLSAATAMSAVSVQPQLRRLRLSRRPPTPSLCHSRSFPV